MACHLPPGGSATLIWDHVKAGKLVVAQIMGYEKPINPESEVSKDIETERCERCHDLETRKVTPSKSVPHMTSEAHLKHLAAGLTCATCHNRVAHAAMDSGEIDYDKKDKGPNFIYENFVEMKDGCLRCHNGEKPYTAPNGAIAPTDCTTCHTPDWEDMPIGHVGDWRSQHGAVAKRDFKYCLGSISVKGETGGCHAANAKFNFQGDKPFCAQCHDKKKVSTFVKAADEKI
jgi:nitrate/TMAO reductase-like tetraheme cytochrome c subunit